MPRYYCGTYQGYALGRTRGIPPIPVWRTPHRGTHLQLCKDCETVRKGDDLVVCAVHNEHRVSDLVHLGTDIRTHV